MSSNVRRKDPCPCGSGKKYKNCCGKRGAKSSSRKWAGLKFGLLAIVVVGGGIAAYMILSKPTTTPQEVITTEAPPKSVQPLQTQPPGPAPEGKVWSPEHRHWHDTAGSASDFATKFTPQPPGPAPEGKVWSSEHGHWHNAPGAATPSRSGTNPISITPGGTPKSSGELTPQPPGPPPEGKVWSPEHGHWHNAPGTATPSGSGTNKISITPKTAPKSGD